MAHSPFRILNILFFKSSSKSSHGFLHFTCVINLPSFTVFMLYRDLTLSFHIFPSVSYSDRLAMYCFYVSILMYEINIKENEKGGKSMQIKKKEIISDELKSRYWYIYSLQPYHQLHAGRRWITVMFRLLERERKTNMHLGRLYDSPRMPWSLECQQGSIIFSNVTCSLWCTQLCLLCLLHCFPTVPSDL